MRQFHALVLLSQSPQRLGNISAYLGKGLSPAKTIADLLLNRGLVERLADLDDRRVVICQLTSRGRGEMERFWRDSRIRFAETASHLMTEELQKVVQAMELIYRVGPQAHGTHSGEYSTLAGAPEVKDIRETYRIV